MGPWVQRLQPLKVWMEAPDYQDKIYQLFLKADRDRNGCLEWNNGEIRNFIRSAYESTVIPYQFGTVNLYDYVNVHRTYIRSYPSFPWVQRLQPLKVWMEAPDYQDKIYQLFLQADRDRNGCLEWNNGEI